MGTEAIFELDEQSHIHAMWFGGRDGIDVLMLLFRANVAAPWRVTMRTRVHRKGGGPDPFSDGDKKRVQSYECPDLKTAIQVAETIALASKTIMKVELQHHSVDGGADKLMEIFYRQPWTYFRDAQ